MFQIDRFLCVGAGGEQRFDRAVGEQRAECERQVGRVEHFDARCCHQLRQALAAEFGRMLHALPAGFAEGLERFLETFGGGDLAIVPAAWRLVAGPVQRGNDFAAEFGIFFQHRFYRFRGRVFAAWQGVHGGQAGERIHRKQHIFQRGNITHDRTPVYGQK